MKLFEYEICTPSLVYFVIGITLALVGALIASYYSGMSQIFQTISQSICQIISVLLCTVLLVWICSLGKDNSKYGVTVAWVITGVYLCCLTLFLSIISSVLSATKKS